MKLIFTFTFVLPLYLSAKTANTATSGGWPQYRGPNGDGTTTETLAKSWGASGPKALWRVPVTAGFSSIAVGEGVAASLMTRDHEGNPMETLVVWDAAKGTEMWAKPLGFSRYDGGGNAGEKGNDGGDGCRSTPSISGGKIYAYGASLDLYCFNAKDGSLVWQKDIVREFNGKNIKWQNASSPILEGGLCIVGGGKSGSAFLAFDAATGNLKWKCENDTITHATPTVATIHGVRQVIFFTKEGLAAVDVKDGKLLWRQAYPFTISTAASPVVYQDIVYCSAGYGVGGGAYQIKKEGGTFSATELWRKPGDCQNHWSTPVCKDGYLYGMFSFKQYGKGPLQCVDIKTGEVKWSRDGFGPGNVILAGGGRILALSDKGELVMVAAKPDAYTEVCRADVLEGKCWSTPTLAHGRIYARSTKEAACFDAK